MGQSMFERLLKEATEELGATEVAEPVDGAEETTPAVEEEPETTEEEPEEGEAKEGTIQAKLQDVILSILDAIEQESLADGNPLDDDESADVGLELLHKLAPKFSDEDAQLAYDELTEYFDMSADEETTPAGEDDEFFEPPVEELPEDGYEEDKEVKTEGIKKKSKGFLKK